MKIIHCCLAQRFLDRYDYQENILVRNDALAGHEVFILASTETYIDNKNIGYVAPCEYLTDDGVPVKRLPYRKIFSHFLTIKLRLYKNLTKELHRINPDLIFIHGHHFLSIFEIARFVKNRPHITVFVDSHSDYYNCAKTWLSKYILHKFIYKFCAKIILPFTEKFYGTLPIRCDFLHDIYDIPKNKIEFLPLLCSPRRCELPHLNHPPARRCEVPPLNHPPKQSPCHYPPSPSLRGSSLESPPPRRCEVPSCYPHEAISVSLPPSRPCEDPSCDPPSPSLRGPSHESPPEAISVSLPPARRCELPPLNHPPKQSPCYYKTEQIHPKSVSKKSPHFSVFSISVRSVPSLKISVLKRKKHLSLLKRKNPKNPNFTIITGGKLEPRKKTLDLMKLINNLAKNNLKLLIFGSVNDEIKNEFYSLLSDNIIFLGWLEPNEIYRLFEECDLAVFPGTHSILWEQAINSGIPCIFKYWQGFTHLTEYENCKFLYSESLEELEMAILEQINNKSAVE